MAKPTTTHRTPTEAAADRRVQALADDATQPLRVPGTHAGNGAPAAASSDGDGVQADPTRAPVGAFEPTGGAVQASAGSGRPPSALELATDRLLVAEGAVLAHLAEQHRTDDMIVADRTRIQRLKELVTEAIRKRDDDGSRQLVPAELLGQILSEAQAWGKDRDLR